MAAVEARSFLVFDLVHWICHVTETLVVASRAPSSSQHARRELLRNATWLIYVLDFLPDDKEATKFVENFQFIDTVFGVGLRAQNNEAAEVAEAARNILLNWTFKAGKHATGWASLERGVTALSALAVHEAGSDGTAWLTTKFAEFLGNSDVDPERRKRVAEHIREKASGYGGFARSEVDYAISELEHGRFSSVMRAVADLLDPPSVTPPSAN